MKKFVCICLFVFNTFCLFAQNSKYTELYNKGQQYEAQKNWTYALGSYIDAIAEDPFNSKPAYDRINEITSSIKAGNPGIGTYKGLNLFNGWKELLISTEQYWNENCPVIFSISTPEFKNARNSSADYSSVITCQCSEKYNIIMSAIYAGYKKVYQDTWSLPFEWPENSVSTGKFERTVETYFYNLYPPSTNCSDFLNNSVATVAGKSHIGSTSKLDKQSNKTNYFSTFIGIYNIYNAFTKPELYELHIKLVTKDGKTIISQKSITFDDDYYVSYIGAGTLKMTTDFNNLTLSQAKLIDDGKVVPVIDSVSLHYGTYETQINTDSLKERTLRSVKEFPSTKYASTKTILFSNENLDSVDPYTWYYIHQLDLDSFKISIDNESFDGHRESIDINTKYESFLNSSEYEIYIHIPLWKVADYLNHLKGLPSSYNNQGELIGKKGFYVEKSDPYYKLIHNVEYTKEYKEKIIDDLIVTANKKIEELKLILTVLDYKEYDYKEHSEKYKKYEELKNRLTKAIKDRDAEQLQIKEPYYRDYDDDIKYKDYDNYSFDNYSYEGYVSLYESIEKDAEYVKTNYQTIKTKYEELYNELKNDTTSIDQLNSFKSILDKYKTLEKTIVAQANYKEKLSKINFSYLERKLKDYKTKISSTESVLKELKENIKNLENNIAEYKLSDEKIKTHIINAKNAIKAYEECISNKTYHKLDTVSDDLSSNNRSLRKDVSSVDYQIDELKRIEELKETLKSDAEVYWKSLKEYKEKLSQYPSDESVTKNIKEIEELLSSTDSNTLTKEVDIIKLKNEINTINFSSIDSYISFQETLVKLNESIQKKSESILLDCKLKQSEIPDKSNDNIFLTKLNSIKNKVLKIKNEKYTSISVCNSKLDELNKISFNTFDSMISNYNEGIKILSQIGLSLKPNSKLSTDSAPAYDLVAEKKSIAAREKLKGTIILSDMTYNDFIITIGMNKGKYFTFKTTKKNFEIHLPEDK